MVAPLTPVELVEPLVLEGEELLLEAVGEVLLEPLDKEPLLDIEPDALPEALP